MKTVKIFSDYAKIKLATPEGRMQFFGAITAFMRKPVDVQNKLIEMGTTQFTSSSGFSTEIKELIENLHLGIEALDVGYLNFFNVRDFSNVPTPGFEVRDVSSGLTFSKRPEGGKADIYRVTGNKIYVGFDMYGGGLEFDEAWFQDQQWWMIEDTALEFRSKWYEDKAAIFYGLIGALNASYNVAYDAVGATVLDKDINTLNNAAAALLTAMKAAGYTVNPQTPLVCLSPIQLKSRLERALSAMNLQPAALASQIKIEYTIKPVYSMNVLNAGAACTDKWYLGVPGLKNKIGEKMPLTTYAQFNIENFATTAVGWGRFGAYLNEMQLRRLATA